MEQHLTPDKLPLHFAYTSAFAFDDLSDVDSAVDTGSVGGPTGGAALDFLGVVTIFWTRSSVAFRDSFVGSAGRFAFVTTLLGPVCHCCFGDTSALRLISHSRVTSATGPLRTLLFLCDPDLVDPPWKAIWHEYGATRPSPPCTLNT